MKHAMGEEVMLSMREEGTLLSCFSSECKDLVRKGGGNMKELNLGKREMFSKPMISEYFLHLQ